MTSRSSPILSDPNRADDEEYITRLVGQVITVSVETMKLIAGLPSLTEVKAVRAAVEPPPVVPSYPPAEADAAHHYFAKEDPLPG